MVTQTRKFVGGSFQVMFSIINYTINVATNSKAQSMFVMVVEVVKMKMRNVSNITKLFNS